MLKGIDALLTPDLLHALASMGHGDELALVDANFPAASVGRRVVQTAGADGPAALEAILSVFPVDTDTTLPALTMAVIADRDAVPPPVAQFRTILAHHGVSAVGTLDRDAFYARARSAFVVVRCSELRPYGNLILVKGVVNRVDRR